MQPEQLVENMSESLYLRLREAVETGRWPDGQPLSDTQHSDSMTLVMMYQARKLNQTDLFSIGQDGSWQQKSKAEVRREMNGSPSFDTESQTISRFSLAPAKEPL